MHSTLIVARMRPSDGMDVARLFAEFDSTDMPALMGTRRRQLFGFHGLYFHLQDFDRDDGGEAIPLDAYGLRVGNGREAKTADLSRTGKSMMWLGSFEVVTTAPFMRTQARVRHLAPIAGACDWRCPRILRVFSCGRAVL